MRLYMGLDSSTQGLKAELIDLDAPKNTAAENVNFGRDLPEYGCEAGTLKNTDQRVKHSDPLMWVAALELLMEKIRAAGWPLEQVKGISGSGQQHGSVFLNQDFERVLRALNSRLPLAEQIRTSLARPTSPIWMDTSTSEECAELKEKFGDKMRELTGSAATERFTGPQIRKFFKTEPEKYGNTASIHLVSSFMASILAGRNAPVDFGDGAGMNLLNLKTLDWDSEIAESTAPGLMSKLPKAVSSDTVVSRINPFFLQYGFSKECAVVVWSGDNPCSLIGTGAHEPGAAVVSLGTSDTFFAAMPSPKIDPGGCGHVFGNPAGGFMSLTCFLNGSLAREELRNRLGLDWNTINASLASAPPEGDENLMLPNFGPEITPPSPAGIRLQGSPEFLSGKATPAVQIRALFESQALRMRLHSEWIGNFKRIRVTGGASESECLVRILANVFQSDAERISVTDSAGLGAAMRAANAVEGVSFKELSAAFSKAVSVTKPYPGAAPRYLRMLAAYRRLEQE